MKIDAIAVREAFTAGRTYRVVVSSWLQLGVLEDLLADLWKEGLLVAGYDIHPDPRGCVVELRESGECMVDAELDHVDLRLLAVGEAIDHFIDGDDARCEALVSIEPERCFAPARDTNSFFWFEALLPKRYTNEEFGDAEEEISRRRAEGCSPWWVRLKILTTIFWVLIHIVVEEYARMKKALRP